MLVPLLCPDRSCVLVFVSPDCIWHSVVTVWRAILYDILAYSHLPQANCFLILTAAVSTVLNEEKSVCHYVLRLSNVHLAV
jgi:hypothetical protein